MEKAKFNNSRFLVWSLLSFDSFIYLHFPEGLFRKIHFAQLWLDKHQLASYVLKVLVLHPSRWPLTLRISLSTPSRTHCTCEGLSCTAWNVTFKYLGKITRILCQRHSSYIDKASFCLSKISSTSHHHLAISGTRGSSGFGSQRREQMESSTWEKNVSNLDKFLLLSQGIM